MLLVLVGVCTSSAANILVARSRGAVHPALLNSLQMVLGGGILLAVAMRVEGPPVAVPAWQFLVVLLYMAALSAVGFTIWFALLKHQKVSRLNMWRFVIPVFGAVICWVSLEDESPDVISVIGMVCVAGSVLLSHRQAASEALAFRAGA
jgi:drug/metabolite transporter (DMT)-like permease